MLRKRSEAALKVCRVFFFETCGFDLMIEAFVGNANIFNKLFDVRETGRKGDAWIGKKSADKRENCGKARHGENDRPCILDFA